MKKAILLIILCLSLIQCKDNKNESILIHGKVKNSNQEYVVLSYSPRLRGNLNLDGINSIGTEIDKNGNFTFNSVSISDSADYDFYINNKSFSLILFRGDNINLDFDLNNIDSSLFVTGKGAGKINVLHLQQFRPLISLSSFNDIFGFDSFIDSLVNTQLSLLEAIYKRDIENKTIKEAENKSIIKKIIYNSPISDSEYDFLKKKILLSKFDNILYMVNRGLADTTRIDFSSSCFNYSNKKNYESIKNINHWQFGGALESILTLEYLRSKQKINPQLTYKDWKYFWQDSLFNEFASSFIKTNFNTGILNKFYADELADKMTQGESYTELFNNLRKQCSNAKYLSRIENFNDLLKNGLKNTEYNLGADKLQLNPRSVDSLIESHKGKPLYVIIWSARFAGSSMIPLMASIMEFGKNYSDELEILNICVDENKYKNLWAARIIDNSWKANHYFIPAEGNDSIIHKFKCEDIFSFCEGGATYYFIDKDGKILNNVEAPIMLTRDKINGYLNKTVR